MGELAQAESGLAYVETALRYLAAAARQLSRAELQKAVEKILESKVSVTEQEVKDYFENNSQLFGEEAVFDEVKEDISQQMINEKLNTEYGNWVTGLKEESNIIYFTNY